MTIAIFDHTCLQAAYKGHEFMTGVLVEASYGRGTVIVPALTAVASGEGVGTYALRLRSAVIAPFTADHAEYALQHPTVPWTVVHAAAIAHSALMSGERAALITLDPSLYDGLGLDPLNPDA